MTEAAPPLQFMRWTPAADKRLRALWLAWYRTSQIAKIFNCSQAAVLSHAYRLGLPGRPRGEWYRFCPDPALEIWPEPVTAPSLNKGGRPTILWPPERVADALRLRATGLTHKAIAEQFGPPYTKSAVLGKLTRLGAVAGPRFYAPAVYVVPLYLRLRPRPLRRNKQVIRLPWAPLGQPLVVRQRKQSASNSVVVLVAAALPKPIPRQLPKVEKPVPIAQEAASAERALIDKFLREKGATVCPPKFAAATEVALSAEDERRRIEAVPMITKRTKEELRVERDRLTKKSIEWREKVKKLRRTVA